MWLSIAALDRSLQRPRRATALLAGALAGAAALTQFFGIAAILTIAVSVLAPTASRRAAIALAPWIAIGFTLVCVPYAIYAGVHFDDWLGQNVTIRDPGRVAFASPLFYLANLVREPARYATLTPSVLIILPAVVILVRRVVRQRRPQDVLMAAALVVPAIVLALLDSTKAALYSAVLLPAVCMLVAMAASDLVDWQRRARSHLARGLTALAAIAAVIMLADGAAAYRLDWQRSNDATRYLDVAARIRSVIPDGAPVLGPHRWWWALHDRPYRALHGIWWQWRLALDAGRPVRFADYVASANARYVIVTDDVRADVMWLPSDMQDEFWQFLNTSCHRASAWRDETYRSIELYEVDAP